MIFLHVPRTGGSTFWRLLEKHYPDVYSVDPFNLEESLREASKFDVVRGHIGYGVLEGQHLTMLRDPVERVLSEYRYASQRHGHHLHAVAKRMPLEQFVTEGVSPSTDNQQVRLLCGNTDLSTSPYQFPCAPFGGVTESMLERAKDNLRKCIVGVTERHGAFVDKCRARFGWPEVRYERLNRTRNKLDVPSRIRELIAEQNRFDMELYELAETLA